MPVEVYTELNPQPLPPGPPPEAYGAVLGRERVKLQWQADKLGQRVTPLADWEDDPCPTYPRAPKLPPWLPPVPDPNPGWLDDYYLGLACALAVGGAGVRESAFVGEASTGHSRRSAGRTTLRRRADWLRTLTAQNKAVASWASSRSTAAAGVARPSSTAAVHACAGTAARTGASTLSCRCCGSEPSGASPVVSLTLLAAPSALATRRGARTPMTWAKVCR
jgi:hypothetical protein